MSTSLLTKLTERVGRPLGTTGWETITQADVQRFADATRAHEWIHLDPERCARESPFHVPVAHGYLTLSLATRFITELLGGVGGAVGVNYGVDRVRFPFPVPVGSAVRAHGTLLAANATDKGIRTVIELVYETEAAPRPPCIAEVVSLLVPDAGEY
jgi:acyl dehydratase